MIRVERVGAEWTMTGEGEDVRTAGQFVRELVTSGRSSYTQRSYALGLAAFLRWLVQTDLELSQVTRQVIVRYTRALTQEAKQPLSAASVNHRLCVLSSFFAWLMDGNGAGEARAHH